MNKLFDMLNEKSYISPVLDVVDFKNLDVITFSGEEFTTENGEVGKKWNEGWDEYNP